MSDDIFFEDGKSLLRICTDAAPGISIHKKYGGGISLLTKVGIIKGLMTLPKGIELSGL